MPARALTATPKRQVQILLAGCGINGLVLIDMDDPDQVAFVDSMKIGEMHPTNIEAKCVGFAEDGTPIFELVTLEVAGQTLKALSQAERVARMREHHASQARYAMRVRSRAKALLPVMRPHTWRRERRPRRQRVTSGPRRSRAPDPHEPDLAAQPATSGFLCVDRVLAQLNGENRELSAPDKKRRRRFVGPLRRAEKGRAW